VIVLSVRAEQESWAECLEHGADDYLLRPFSASELRTRVAAHVALTRLRKVTPQREALGAALEEIGRLKEQLRAQDVRLQEEAKPNDCHDEILGKNEALQKGLAQAEQVAATDATVLILGETGTGKELLARAIHNRSPRHARPMVMLNCAALPPTLLE